MGNSIYSSEHLDLRWEGIVGGGWCAHVQEGEDVPPPKGCTVEPIHIYLLANVLGRPIVVLTGPNAGGLSTEEDLRGVYLPFEHEPDDVTKYPILLGYSHSMLHFAPLVTATTTNTTQVANKKASVTTVQQSVPVTDAMLALLPVPFAVLPTEDWIPDENTAADITPLNNEQVVQELAKYLHASTVQFSNDGDTSTAKKTIAVKINTTHKPQGYDDLLKNYVKGAKGRFKNVKKTMKCKTAKCKRMPSSQLNGVCYKCYNKTASNSDLAE
jgi:hypothetical protein